MPINRECYSDPSAAVQSAIDDALQVSDWMRAHHPEQVSGEPRICLSVAFNSIALDHREAIVLLMSHGARSSAYALMRSMIEAHLRGGWARHRATDEEIRRALAEGILPGVDKMVRGLNKVPDTLGAFGNTKRILWERLSEFTHSGMLQVDRWLGPEGIAQRHTDAECLTTLRTADIFGLLTFMGTLECAGESIDLAAEKAREAIARLRAHAEAVKVGVQLATPLEQP